MLSNRLGQLFAQCLRSGEFPQAWREAFLVLLHKEGKPEDSPSVYRPICLLDEVGKLFERVIAVRIVQHLSRDGFDLNEDQQGFRGGRSTVDVVLQVRSLAESNAREGRVTLAVSLDIANAFNSLPFKLIGESLIFMVSCVILDGLFGTFSATDVSPTVIVKGSWAEGRCTAEFHRGQFLTLSWNLAYDRVLRAALPLGCSAMQMTRLSWLAGCFDRTRCA